MERLLAISNILTAMFFFDWRKNVPCSEILNDESWHRVKAGDFAAAVRMMFRREITMSRFTDKIKELAIERDMYKCKCEKLQNLMDTQKVNRKLKMEVYL